MFIVLKSKLVVTLYIIMNKKIKLLGVTLVAVAALFAGASFASAQTAMVASCSSATLNATLSDTGGASTSVWF